jgi:hypothetical protein
MKLSIQFQHIVPPMPEGYDAPQQHYLNATVEGKNVGTLGWTHEEVGSLFVRPSFRRQGVATSLWNEAHRIANENTSVPPPKHSSTRSDEGDVWAKAVGGSLPPRRGEGG